MIVATGPTSPALADAIHALTGENALAFFDAIAAIVHGESIDFERAWFQSRYDKAGPAGNGADYINCSLDKLPYLAFVEALLAGEKTEFKAWESSTPYFEGCLPIEVMAARGPNTLRFGPMKPVGLVEPHTSRRPTRWSSCARTMRWALFNMVVSDQAPAWRAGPHLPHDPRPRAPPSSRGWAGCIATRFSTARDCSIASCA